MYEDIVYLLGDARASGTVSNDRRKKPGASQAIPESSNAPALTQTPTAASFAIDPVLQAVSSEMLSNQGVYSEEAVRYNLLVSTVDGVDLRRHQSNHAGPSNKGKERAPQGLENEKISSVSYFILLSLLLSSNRIRTRRRRRSIAKQPASAPRNHHRPGMIGAKCGASPQQRPFPMSRIAWDLNWTP